MVKTYTTNTFASDYKDDYDEDKGFHKVLFNSKKALQARELTQMQTIIQEGITRFGKNIFKDGAPLSGATIKIDNKYRFIKLDTSVNSLPSDTTTLLNKSFTGQTSGVTFKIVDRTEHVSAAEPATLYVQYTSTSTGVASTTAVTVTPGEEISEVQGNVKLTVQTTNTESNPAVGFGTKFSAGDADYFTNGHFVHVPFQDLIISKYNTKITKTMGFKVTEDIVTPTDDNTLYDNQSTNPNLTAPGADRYRIRLTLTSEDLINSATETFVYVAQVTDSKITDRITGERNYNKLNDMLAKRTEEESGNYTLKPFYLRFHKHDTETKLKAELKQSTAYVSGYRITKNKPTFMDLNKSRTTDVVAGDNTSIGYGNYVLLTSMVGAPDINTLSTHNLMSQENGAGSVIGTCRVRAVEKVAATSNLYIDDAAVYKMYIFDVVITSSSPTKTFSQNCKSINLGSMYGNIAQQNGVSVIHDTQSKCLLFPTNYSRLKLATSIGITQQKSFQTAGDGTASASLTTAGGTVFTDKDNWIIVVDNVVDTSATTALSGSPTGSGVNISLSSSPGADKTIDVIAQIRKTSATVVTKTLATTKATFAYSGGNIDLNEFHITKINEIKLTSSTGSDTSSAFELDDGCRDAFYDMGRLILKPGKKVSASTIYVDFEYFTFTSGDIITPQSYSGTGYTYLNTPNYTKENGKSVSLANYLDFRPKKSTSGEFTGNAVVIQVPKNTISVTSDNEYYLPRADRLVLDEGGTFQYIEGIPAFQPIYPNVPEKSLELYRIKVNPYTFSEKDVAFNIVDNKRYTMRDIGKIENRISRVEDAVSLSLLELDTKSMTVLDANGNPRTRSGFVADDFRDQTFTDRTSPEYRASIDPASSHARPGFASNKIGLYYDPSEATNNNIVFKGDMILKSYTDVEFIKQDLCSSIINVNPFLNMSYNGGIKLTPSSDDWKVVKIGDEQNVLPTTTKLRDAGALLWDEWEWNWGGVDIDDLQVGSSDEMQGETYRDNDYSQDISWMVRSGWLKTDKRRYKRTESGDNWTTGTVVNKVVSSEVIEEVIGNKHFQFATIPKQRSRLVYFEAQGLQPNTQMFAFYGGISVKDWVKQESVVDANDSKQIEYGNLHDAALKHPSDPSTLFTDGNGNLQGSFFIPSVEADVGRAEFKFPTGSTEFKLIDVTVDDDTNAVSFASAIFSTVGELEIRNEDVSSTRYLDVRGEITNVFHGVDVTDPGTTVRCYTDPLAQSFLVNSEFGEGLFVTKVDLFFKTKSVDKSIFVELRPMVNGYPSSYEAINGSRKTLAASAVATSDDATSKTTFEFDYPIYLRAGREYAIICQTDNTDYELWCSKVGEYKLGSSQARINTQPFLGSLFKSQNSMTWEASTWEDMKFTLHRASFSTAASTAVLHNTLLPLKLLDLDPIVLFENPEDHTSVRVKHPNHGFSKGDYVALTGIVDATYATLLNGSKLIDRVDHTGYTFLNSSINDPGFASFPTSPQVFSIVNTGGSTVNASEQISFNLVNPTISHLTPGKTSVTSKMQSTSGRSYAGEAVATYSQPSLADAPYIRLGANNYFETPQLIAQVSKESTLNRSSAIVTSTLTNENEYLSPVIDLERASLTLVENIIDNSDSDQSTLTNRSLNQNATVPTWTSETSKIGGSAAAKHITKSVELIEPAKGLKVILSAHRPNMAFIDLYYKAVLSDVDYSTENWTLYAPDTEMPSDDDPGVFRDYIYTIGGISGFSAENQTAAEIALGLGTNKTFTKFKLKIVMRSRNSSRVPVIKDLRAIALVT